MNQNQNKTNKRPDRVYNFSPGPSTLATEVLEDIQSELLDWKGLGVSVLEISHRHKSFEALTSSAEEKLRRLLSIPETHAVFFMAAPSRAQFSGAPLNLTKQDQKIGYLDTGLWSHMALKEAQRLNNVVVSYRAESGLPTLDDFDPSDLAYLYYCDNETIQGIEFPSNYTLPNVPLVCDMTSNILSRSIDFNAFDLIFAGAQKNFGIAGLVAIIIRRTCLDRARPGVPITLHYQTLCEANSLYYTPDTFSIYVADKIFDWVESKGGVSYFESLAKTRSDLLYNFIDQSSFYENTVLHSCRSRMNIPFALAKESLNESFLKAAAEHGLFALKGHRLVGGMRASLYNAMPLAGVETLIDFMADFEKKN